MGGKIVPEKLIGKYITLREVTVDDADFILSLRCDAIKSRFLHRTSNDKSAQIAYIQKYFNLPNEWYFISENKLGKKLGTFRIYDIKDDSFCFGSWLMVDGTTPWESFETDYLVRMYGFDILGFNKIHFDVRKDNKKVWNYHQSLGAKRIGETELDFLFEVTKEDYIAKAEVMWKTMRVLANFS